jgi:Phosphotransferase system, mannose/fructose-specific component IIA
MVKILVVTHGSLGTTLLNTANMIFGNVKNAIALELYHGDSIDDLQEKIKKEITAEKKEDGILVLTDLFGGSPCNMTAMVMKELSGAANVECLAGVNMPMLIEALTMQGNMPLKELVEHCKNTGVTGIVNLREELHF